MAAKHPCADCDGTGGPPFSGTVCTACDGTGSAPPKDRAERAPESILGEFIDDESLMQTGRSIGTVGSFRVATALAEAARTDKAVADALLAVLVKAGVLGAETKLGWTFNDDKQMVQVDFTHLATMWLPADPDE